MWLGAGLMLGAAIILIAVWLTRSGVPLRWYELFVAVVGSLGIGFGLQNFFATQAERWSFGTPLTFLITFALPGTILFGIVSLSVSWRYFKAKRLQQATVND